MKGKSFGQGGTEYLVLLSIVLVIALVSVALLAFFPGMASDAARAEYQAYWRSATPIAIVDGTAYAYATLGGPENNGGVKFVLQNNGPYTIELLAISKEANVNNEGDPEEGVRSKAWAYFSPEYLGSYIAYVGPPHGTGFQERNDRIYIAPGEKITVGYNVLHGIAGHGPYNPKAVCLMAIPDSQVPEIKSWIEFPPVTFYYRQIIDGKPGIPKKQYGAKPIILNCLDATMS
ncbi:MAG: hypothetical protein N3F07_01340 [Candidatus Micrarchaeota archaeon]|nr:hypothetical protein [Candidatus Micrarchaeota archaeon]